jgi:hypothetical protein
MTELVALAAIAIVAWFAAGTIWNVRTGRELMRWMQGGLPSLGGRTSVRWLGSSVVELAIRDASAPFARATVVLFFEPRDLPWWPLSRLSGRRDTLIVRGVLRKAPNSECEVLEAGSWSARDALPRLPREWVERNAGEFAVRHADAGGFALAEALIALAQKSGLAVRRISVRRSEPNFQLHVGLPDRRQDAHQFFSTVRILAERAIV